MAEPDWEITATTVYCEAVDDEVTLMVFADGTAKCTGRQKYTQPNKKTKRSTQTKNRECVEVNCSTLNRYRESLLKS